jgi:rod shape-determining protein MreD
VSRQRTLTIAKHAIYALTVVFLHVLGSVPGLFVLWDIKPELAIPAAVAIAMCEDEFSGGIYGALAGLLLDTGSFLLFGFNGFVAMLCCVAAGLMVTFLMRCNALTFLLFAAASMLVLGSLEYFFSYGMWGYAGAGSIYTARTLPTVAYSTLGGFPAFFFIRFIGRRFAVSKEEPK